MAEGIQFDEDKINYGQRPGVGGQNLPGTEQPKMIRWIMGMGLTKSPAVAQGILIAVVIICLVIVFVVLF